VCYEMCCHKLQHSLSSVLVVQFDPVSYVVTEGGQTSLFATLNLVADYAVSVDFATRNGTALGK
jgi:hypothetical protein